MNVEDFLDNAATCQDDASDDERENVLELLTDKNFIDNDPVDDDDVTPLNPYLSSDDEGIPCAQAQLNSPPKKKSRSRPKDVRDPPAVHWCFTLNNYTDEEYENLKSIFPEHVRYMILAKEVGDENETPHIQGYCQFNPKKRFENVKEILGERCHIEKCKGNPAQNIEYCKKGGDFVEFGECKGSGKQKIRTIIEKLREGGKVSEIIESDLCHSYVTNRQNIRMTLKDITEEVASENREKKDIQKIKLHPWQRDLIEMFNQYSENDRVIFWIYDPVGGAGKSYFCDYMSDKDPMNVIVMDNQMSRDISCAYGGQKYVLFDFVREEEHDIKYGVLEKLKNGRIFSAKYESHVKVFKKPTVCVFANHVPRVKMLSIDRWKIYKVSKNSGLMWEDVENLYHLQEES